MLQGHNSNNAHGGESIPINPKPRMCELNQLLPSNNEGIPRQSLQRCGLSSTHSTETQLFTVGAKEAVTTSSGIGANVEFL